VRAGKVDVIVVYKVDRLTRIGAVAIRSAPFSLCSERLSTGNAPRGRLMYLLCPRPSDWSSPGGPMHDERDRTLEAREWTDTIQSVIAFEGTGQADPRHRPDYPSASDLVGDHRCSRARSPISFHPRRKRDRVRWRQDQITVCETLRRPEAVNERESGRDAPRCGDGVSPPAYGGKNLDLTHQEPCQPARSVARLFARRRLPCLAIRDDPLQAATLTSRANLVAVVTNGTAVLGLGNIGALAGKPVMEGKGCLFKKFAGIDVFDIEIDATDPDKIVDIVAALEPTFGGINLEDIKAPECFIVERKLRERMKILFTGRSDYPNQVNNVLCFPFIFRGALDVGATTINEAMKLAAVQAIAELAHAEESDIVARAYGRRSLSFGPEYLIP
jgi:Malic enzyme, N-terminal domain